MTLDEWRLIEQAVLFHAASWDDGVCQCGEDMNYRGRFSAFKLDRHRYEVVFALGKANCPY